MDRQAEILALFDTTGFGLEIGPSYNPLCPKSEGFNVETLDHATQEQLRRKYNDQDVTKIEAVDYVSDGRSMQDVIGATKRYDFIVASHVIEHTPDFVGFLKDCEALLKDGGVLVLAVPDKRFCFDYFRPLTTTGRVIEVHRQGRDRHTYAGVFDHRAYVCHTIDGGRITWHNAERPEKKLVHTLKSAVDLADRVDAGPYIDTHAWQFTPSSFRLIIQELNVLGLIGMKEASAVWDTGIWEFRVVLSRGGAGSGLTRLQLLEMADEEISGLKNDPRIADTNRLGEIALTAKKEAETAKSEAETYKQEINALYTSSSWKLTKPLRKLRAAVGRLF